MAWRHRPTSVEYIGRRYIIFGYLRPGGVWEGKTKDKKTGEVSSMIAVNRDRFIKQVNKKFGLR